MKFGRELNSIVSNLTVIVNFNNHLLSKLKQTNEDDIGKTFQMIIPFLKTYTQYFSNYEAALNSIREADKNPKNKRFSEWLKKTDDRAKEQGQQTFKQLLIQPVQRIPVCFFLYSFQFLITNSYSFKYIFNCKSYSFKYLHTCK